jgi:hypothetical protein
LNEEASPLTTPSTIASQQFETPQVNQQFTLRSKEALVSSLIIATMTTALLLPVLFHGLPNGHDAAVHYRWAVQFKDALQEPGVFYPRWLASANNNQGSPAMLYYPPLPFFITTALSFLTNDVLSALALGCWLGLFLSGVTMYIFCRSHFSYRLSLFAAFVYLAMPYHLFDLYHRTALSEFWSFAWVPLIFTAVDRLATQDNWRATAFLAFSYGLLLFTHLPIAFALTLVLPIYCLLLTQRLKALVQITIGLALGFGLSAIFTIPVLFERDEVRIQRLIGIKYDNNYLFENFLNPPVWQLSAQGEVDTLKLADWIAISLLLILLFALLMFFFNRASRIVAKRTASTLWAISAVAAVALLMTTRLSAPIWKSIPQLAYMQFPFRWLTITSLATTVLTVGSFAFFRAARKSRSLALISFLFLTLTLGLSATVILKASYDRQAILNGLAAIEVKEYFPVWWEQSKRAERQNFGEDFPAVTLADGTAEVSIKDDAGINQTYEVKADDEALLDFRTLYFPGWVAYVDGERRTVAPNDKGNIRLAIEPGTHTVTLKFADTPPRTAGKLISAISFLVMLGAFAFSKKMARRAASLVPANLENNEEAQ